jgi:hypothetical protein
MRIAKNRDETGNRYGRWTVVSRGPNENKGDFRRWRCKCDCGNIGVVRQAQLRNGMSRSCGCFQRDYIKERMFKHGECHPPTKEYAAWIAMKSRCCDPKHNAYKDYGGRGVTVCPRWLESYPDFLADVGRAPSSKHTLGRKDNSGNYEIGNVRWETRIQQNRNTRRNHLITIEKRTLSVAEWALESGVNRETIYGRLKRGVPPANAIFDRPFGLPQSIALKCR